MLKFMDSPEGESSSELTNKIGLIFAWILAFSGKYIIHVKYHKISHLGNLISAKYQEKYLKNETWMPKSWKQ